MPQGPLNLQTLLEVPYVEWDYGFDISPDSQQVAFSWNLSGRWEIYLAPLDGSQPPKPVTAGSGAKFTPRWSWDGQRLLYVLDEDGGELFDLYVYDLNSGTHTNLTPDTPEAIQPEPCWSPDGAQVAFISDRSSRFETYVKSLAGGEARKVLDVSYPHYKLAWSPDGRWLVTVTLGEGQDFYTYIVPLDGGEPFAIAGSQGPVCAKDVAWSPDSKFLAFSSDLPGEYNIGLFELENRQLKWLTAGAGDKEFPAWAPDGQKLVYVAGDGPQNSLALLDLSSGETVTYQVAPGIHYRPHFTPDGRQVLFAFDNPSRPADLWALSFPDGAFRQLTYSLPTGLKKARFALPEEVAYASLDGRQVPALLYRPPKTKGLPPAVVYIHGGPNWITQITWDPLVQHMVSRGWVVVAPNYRGSIGFGREWQLASRFDLGGGETLDVVAAADYLAQQGIADPPRIAVTGRSHGGYLTMTSLTRFPDRWAGGSAVVPFLNWFTGHENCREDLQHWDLENFGDPVKDYKRYYERSPLFFLDRVAAPVQLVCGAHDPRCPVSESVQARNALRSLGKPCDFVLYPDEGHVFLKIENIVDAKQRQVDFLAQVLNAA